MSIPVYVVEAAGPSAPWHELYREASRSRADERMRTLAQSAARSLYAPHGGHRLRVREVAR